MTRPDLDALDALLAKATPGPWLQDDESSVCANNEVIAVPCGGFDEPDIQQQDDNIALIVAAVNALPALIANVRALEQDAARYRWLREPPSGAHEQLCVCTIDNALFGNQLDAAIDAARAAVKDAT